mmetsp:Transcript_15229/g.31959  ORF Transcript_15229/g.31959 Transcript_15229/m.31959 type:complete len:246 (-) Transcript_15229:728-1465(-)
MDVERDQGARKRPCGDDVEGQRGAEVRAIVSFRADDHGGGEGDAHGLEKIRGCASHVRDILSDGIEVVHRMHRGERLLHLLLYLLPELSLLLCDEAHILLLHSGIRVQDVLPRNVIIVHLPVPVLIGEVRCILQCVEVVHLEVVHVLAEHRGDKVRADVRALGEDASSNAVVEGYYAHTSAKAYESVGVANDDPDKHHTKLSHRMRAQPTDGASTDPHLDASNEVVVQRVCESGAALEIHVRTQD